MEVTVNESKHTSSDIVESVDDSRQSREEIFTVHFLSLLTQSVLMRLDTHRRIHLFHCHCRRRRLRSLFAYLFLINYSVQAVWRNLSREFYTTNPHRWRV